METLGKKLLEGSEAVISHQENNIIVKDKGHAIEFYHNNVTDSFSGKVNGLELTAMELGDLLKKYKIVEMYRKNGEAQELRKKQALKDLLG